MRNLVRGLILAACTSAAVLTVGVGSAAAQGAVDEADRPTIGIGVGASMASFPGLGGLSGATGLFSSHSVMVPIRLGERWRIEPRVNFAATSSSEEVVRPDTTGEERAFEGEREAIQGSAGVGVHYLWTAAEDTYGYVGLLAGATYSESEGESDEPEGAAVFESSNFGLFGGPVLGGEYLVGDVLGVGVETWLRGEYAENDQDGDLFYREREQDSLGVALGADIFMRVYLW